MATTLVVVPIGVAMPPADEAYAVISSRAEAYGERANAAASGPMPAASTEIMPSVTG